ncbi:Auxin-responsive protein [Melia azedarach]|uniref:Auxin-responsive protein n=1 Tax=Melia azedarach TaxID=155640 RepID=A0ACC1YBQ3_MELAZ|nr:Auxin-responsive protein [Melia azedarach]
MLRHEEIEVSGRAPKGHFVVYVGEERMRRFVVPLSCLKDPTFQKLLQKAAEEFGFPGQKRIVLPCDESTFLTLLTSIL